MRPARSRSQTSYYSLNIRVSPDLHDRLCRLATREQNTVSATARRLIALGLHDVSRTKADRDRV